MVEASPANQVCDGMRGALDAHNPGRVSIAGTVESIAGITADTLSGCHAAFYNPGNMVLCVCGDVDPERVADIAREYGMSEAKVTSMLHRMREKLRAALEKEGYGL